MACAYLKQYTSGDKLGVRCTNPAFFDGNTRRVTSSLVCEICLHNSQLKEVTQVETTPETTQVETTPETTQVETTQVETTQVETTQVETTPETTQVETTQVETTPETTQAETTEAPLKTNKQLCKNCLSASKSEITPGMYVCINKFSVRSRHKPFGARATVGKCTQFKNK